MDSSADVTGDGLRKILVRTHAVFLWGITLTAIATSSVGYFRHRGPYALLHDQGWGYIGLYQAYVLMFIIAVVMWVGSGTGGHRRWNALALCAEMAPLSVIFLGHRVFQVTNKEHFAVEGLIIHLTWISVEAFALLWKAPFFQRAAPQAPARA